MPSDNMEPTLRGKTSYKIRAISGSLGAEISGIDLCGIDNHIFAELHDAFIAHQVLIFRDQNLTNDQYIEFARRWGNIRQYPYMKGLESHPEILEIIKDPSDTYAFGNVWHTDGSNYAVPPKATILYAFELPPAGGDTLMADMYSALDTLSPGMQSIIADMKGLNVGGKQLTFSSKVSSMQSRDPGTEQMTTLHPLARTHPVTGKKSLYIGHRTECFENMTPEESAPLINYLRTHAVRPEFTCRLTWEPGSIAIWDNRCTQHYAVDDYTGHRRRMRRITVEAEEAPF